LTFPTKTAGASVVRKPLLSLPNSWSKRTWQNQSQRSLTAWPINRDLVFAGPLGALLIIVERRSWPFHQTLYPQLKHYA
jgi:hypothetical protein